MAQLGGRPTSETMAYGQRPVGLVRNRLLAALDAHRTLRLGLIVAPAGSGKTTLLTQYARTFDGPVWWHVTESGDASVATFCRHLATTMGAADRTCNTVEDLLAMLNEGRVSPHLLVIDDLHRVSQTPGEAALGDFLARLPEWLHVVVASRATPSFNLSQYEMSDIVVVDAEQLRFRAWEVECLLRDVYGEPLPPDDAATLSRRVGGWAAGLHMFHLSTLGRPLAARRHALAALDGRSRRARDYLAATVLAELPEPTRDFLVRTCVFDRVTAERCERLLDTGRATPELPLDPHRNAEGTELPPGTRRTDVAEPTLGTRRTADGNEPDRRDFQAILTDLERRQAFTTSDDGGASFRYHEVLRAHLKVLLREELGDRGARDWYGRAGELLETDGHAAEAVRAYARAEDWHAVRRLVAGVGDEFADDFAHWRDVLPAWLVAEDPWLILAEGRHWLSRGQIARAVEMFRQAEELANDESVRASCRAARGRASVWLPGGASETAPPLPVDHPLSRLRAATRRHSPVGSVEPRYSAALVDGQDDTAALAIAASQLLAGDIRGARRRLDAAVAALQVDDTMPALGLRLAHAAMHLTAGVPGAQDRLARVAVAAERAQWPWLCRMARAAGALDGSEYGIKEAYAVAEECVRDGDAWGTVIASVAAMLAQIIVGDPDVDGLRVLAARCADLDAGVLAGWAEAYAACVTTAEAPAPVVTTPGITALGLVAAARAASTPRAVVSARAAAVTAGLPAGHVDALLGPAPASPARIDESAIRVRCFGGFAMVLPGRELDWAAVKPRTRMALRLLAIHGGRPVHREVLTAALWPEMDQASATRNLHVALSSLRTFLDPGMPRGRCALIVRTGDAYELSLPPDGELDVVAFTAAIAAARRAQLAGDGAEMRSGLHRALSLYTGELLPEDGPAEWVASTRELYHQQAAAAAEQLAAAELEDGDAARALAAAVQCLAIDVYRDRGWRLLADAHRRLGNHAAADRADRDYAAMLASLGLDPSGLPLRTIEAPVSSFRRTPPRPRQPGDGEPIRTPIGSSAGRSPRSRQ